MIGAGLVLMSPGAASATPVSSTAVALPLAAQQPPGLEFDSPDRSQGPAAASAGVNQIDTVSLGTDGHLWADSYGARGWTWSQLPVVGTSGAAVAVSSPTRLDVFVRGVAGDLVDVARVSGVWQAAKSLGGQLAGAPAAVSPNPGALAVFVLGTDNLLYEDAYSPTTMEWTWSRPVGRPFYSDPTASSWGNGRIDVFAGGYYGDVLHTYTNGSGWTKPEDLGGQSAGRLSAVSWAVGRIDVFRRAKSGQLTQLFYAAGRWNSATFNLNITAPPAVTSWAPNRLDVFSRGATGELIHLWYNGAGWVGPESLGGQIV